MATVRVQAGLIDPGAEIAALVAGWTDIGGIGSFIGTVRGTAQGRALRAMTLEHYPGMTERALAGMIVLVLAASAHRQDALEASAFLIDWLKTPAPFWKKESFTDGSEAWVDAREEDTAAAARWGALTGP